jgi:integrase
MKAKITKRTVDALAAGDFIADAEVKGFVVRRLASGTTTYGYRFRNRAGQQRWLPLGLHGQITPDQARVLAKKRAGEVADARDPAVERASKRAATANTLDSVLDTFLDRHVRKNLSSAAEVERALRVYVRPTLGGRSIYDLRRRDILDLLDAIEDNNGPVQADRVLAYLRKAFNWWATRDDQFSPPIVRGMARTKPKERARSRTLDDQEIRDLWAALDEARVPACYPAFVRTLLLSAQRLREISRMQAAERTGDVWVIGAGRYKTKVEHAVPLVAAVRKLIDAELLRGQPKGAKPRKTGFVFSSDGGARSFSGFSKSKVALDAAIAALRKRNGRPPMDAWSHHDLRRSARSLMSRAGVLSDHAERVLGHVIPGVRGVYDRHTFLDEKRDALEALAALVARILQPTEAVVAFPKRPRRARTR